MDWDEIVLWVVAFASLTLVGGAFYGMFRPSFMLKQRRWLKQKVRQGLDRLAL